MPGAIAIVPAEERRVARGDGAATRVGAQEVEVPAVSLQRDQEAGDPLVKIHAELLVWTTSRPLATELGFDQHTTGALASHAGPAHAGPAIAVIVHPERTTTLDLAGVARIYLRQRRFWDDGEAIVALNQPPGSAIREEFFRAVVGSGSASLGDYWNELYFHGIFPPIALSSTGAVKRYITSNRNAIGYVDETDVDSSVRVVLMVHDAH